MTSGGIAQPLLYLTRAGLYCPKGDFYIDPKWPVPRAIVTHAHGDHARSGSAAYLCSEDGLDVTRTRLGYSSEITAIPYGETRQLGDVWVSLHPAGHVLGSVQVRVEYQGEVWVASGDYKRQADPTCRAFVPVPCDHFITEATFALPIYRWPAPSVIMQQMVDWWRDNQAQGLTSIIFAYSFGKAQRILASLPNLPGPIYVHGSVAQLNRAYSSSGVSLAPWQAVSEMPKATDYPGSLVVAPPSTDGSAWLQRFKPYATSFASGWMLIRGNKRRRNVSKGWVLSDHADWPGLLQTIQESQAHTVWVTHGNSPLFTRYLEEQGYQARPLVVTS